VGMKCPRFRAEADSCRLDVSSLLTFWSDNSQPTRPRGSTKEHRRSSCFAAPAHQFDSDRRDHILIRRRSLSSQAFVQSEHKQNEIRRKRIATPSSFAILVDWCGVVGGWLSGFRVELSFVRWRRGGRACVSSVIGALSFGRHDNGIVFSLLGLLVLSIPTVLVKIKMTRAPGEPIHRKW
jgi:hypothetical protein